MDNQEAPTVWHKELCSMLCSSLDGMGVWGRMDTCICVAESLCYAPETIATLSNQLYSNTKPHHSSFHQLSHGFQNMELRDDSTEGLDGYLSFQS